MSGCICCTPIQVSIKSIPIGLLHGRVLKNQLRSRNTCSVGVRASMVDSTESSSNFAKRMERAWLISQALIIRIFFGFYGEVVYILLPCSIYVIDACSNQGPLLALRATPMGMWNVNGVAVQVSSFSATTCFAKSRPEVPAVLFVQERDQNAVPIVREQGFVQSGWKSLPFLSSSANTCNVRTVIVCFYHSDSF
ncbi:hypothetical protein RHSIM_Rhsim07G0166900 [Rhododendron simsii]|uniref:Uncharacterized protein n=1 Tax=Rhododendron simsii TaxID=118357 RepID=A0A834LL95_RHOSS|nr:hypothetical protein RHSIM_Rhsim07G0166900 [Rhododendron simsii]